ncbi:prephenate dehydrogenase [Gangjinia marincola]|uniref:Prephenate dehydrogenase n=1 Tax=Gangjinia marincola TaxID=578463 RepID=A0ABN1MDX6_9FLAO
MKVTIVGVGLIGGSMAIDIKAVYPNAVVSGIDLDKNNLQKAMELHVIDQKGDFQSLFEEDIVIIAIPVDASVNILPKVLDQVGDSTIVIDTGSTKADICNVLRDHPKRRNFLAAHPIAGTEFSGAQAALANLFRNKTNIICEVEKTAFTLQERALELFQKLGMRIRYMDPASHDKHIAFVSHLSHISSFMLGKTVIDEEKNERDIFDMAGSGFESTVRLAKSSPAMWTPIFKQNKDNVIHSLDKYIENLVQFKRLMEQDDFESLYHEMNDTNHIKTILNGMK